ncbi:helix-turn-helix transcriptional regulator [Marinobacterium jannaschii]|uniref:helix-turn-helix transcriptional regulator n=1 Tax=Marinobacterium jannaschii TaxID=64970 RepID=UPI0004895A50|nr:helix-turn-helix transcriptional regulator [Marinobacterium jannaschii]
MISESNVKLLERIYQVILNPDDWEPMVDALNHEIGAYGINMWVGDRVLMDLQSFWASDKIRNSMDAYLHSGFVDAERPLMQTLARITETTGLMEISEFQQEHNRISEDKLDLAALGHWLKQNYGVEERYISALNQHPSYYDCINISFHNANSRKRQQSLATSRFFIPHLANLIAVSRPFLLLKARFNAVLEVLDRFHVGVFLLNNDGSLISHNQLAQEIASAQNGIRLDLKQRLVLSHETDNLRLQQTMTELLASPAQHRQVKLSAKKRSIQTPYLLELSPIYHQEIPLGLLLIVIDPEDRKVIDTGAFSELFGLTQAEQQICQLLAEGYQARDISDIRHTGLETVRGQIKSIQAKTHTRERSELIRLALSINLPVDKQ